MIDTHIHLDGEEFNDDRNDVILRATEVGVTKLFVPAIDLKTSNAAINLARCYPGVCYAMVGLHPEEVRTDWRTHLVAIKTLLMDSLSDGSDNSVKPIAIGEVGLDYYWSREYEKEQLEAFEEQVRWSVETGLPLMIHCRKAQNEMVRLLRLYEKDLPGGVFHCFTGNEHEAEELLAFDKFVLGIGGVLTFKKSNLPTTLPSVVPLSRIVLETDAPYMAPVPHRGKRNESSFIPHICKCLADAYGVDVATADDVTTRNAMKIFNIPY